METYIHYGHKNFDKEKFAPITNREFFTKPWGGFWGSNIKAKYGWKQWCENEDFRECTEENSFLFTLKEDSKILRIDSAQTIKELPMIPIGFDFLSEVAIDFEKIAENYDAIEVVISADYDLYYKLYGWDCDSILIMNPEIIIVKK